MARKTELSDLAREFGLLSNATRLGILKILAAGPEDVAPLWKTLGSKQAVVCHHLGILRLGCLVVGTRRESTVEYAIKAANMKALAAGIATLIPKK